MARRGGFVLVATDGSAQARAAVAAATLFPWPHRPKGGPTSCRMILWRRAIVWMERAGQGRPCFGASTH
jgi:hypothetical protein